MTYSGYCVTHLKVLSEDLLDARAGLFEAERYSQRTFKCTSAYRLNSDTRWPKFERYTERHLEVRSVDLFGRCLRDSFI